MKIYLSKSNINNNYCIFTGFILTDKEKKEIESELILKRYYNKSILLLFYVDQQYEINTESIINVYMIDIHLKNSLYSYKLFDKIPNEHCYYINKSNEHVILRKIYSKFNYIYIYNICILTFAVIMNVSIRHNKVKGIIAAVLYIIFVLLYIKKQIKEIKKNE